MRFSKPILIAAVATAAMVLSTGAAPAHVNGDMNTFMPTLKNYSGAWPVTITRSQFSNGTDCLTLTQNGPNGGQASLVAGTRKYNYGSFVVSRDILVVTISEPLYGQNGALLFVVHANNGHVGQGIFEDDRGGSDFDTGELAFGMKGGC